MAINQHTVKMLECLRDMATTQLVAAEFDKVISEVGNVDSSAEMVAAVVLAQLRSGYGSITMRHDA